MWDGSRWNAVRATSAGWDRFPSKATPFCVRFWWRLRSRHAVMTRSFAESINTAATASPKGWPRWRRHASWRCGCTGCCAPRRPIGRRFTTRAARVIPWSAYARPFAGVGTLAPGRGRMFEQESWPMLGRIVGWWNLIPPGDSQRLHAMPRSPTHGSLELLIAVACPFVP